MNQITKMLQKLAERKLGIAVRNSKIVQPDIPTDSVESALQVMIREPNKVRGLIVLRVADSSSSNGFDADIAALGSPEILEAGLELLAVQIGQAVAQAKVDFAKNGGEVCEDCGKVHPQPDEIEALLAKIFGVPTAREF